MNIFTLLQPFNFEPEISKEELELRSSDTECSDTDRDSDSEDSRIGTNNWCLCGGKCKPMQTTTESLCCRDTTDIPDDHFEGKFIYKIISFNYKLKLLLPSYNPCTYFNYSNILSLLQVHFAKKRYLNRIQFVCL
jgi:hypothetical protein